MTATFVCTVDAIVNHLRRQGFSTVGEHRGEYLAIVGSHAQLFTSQDWEEVLNYTFDLKWLYEGENEIEAVEFIQMHLCEYPGHEPYIAIRPKGSDVYQPVYVGKKFEQVLRSNCA